MEKPILRTTAKAFQLEHFTDQGKIAFKRIVDALYQSVISLDKPSSSQSQLLFLSGNRGVGKTSLLLSLKDLLNKKLTESTLDISREKLEKLAQNIVWLNHMESESLPDSSNLLASIMVRLENAINKKLNKQSQSFNHHYDIQPSSDSDNPILQLQRLQADVAQSWDGNMPQRGEHLDPETLSYEILQAERARRDINDRLSKVLNNFSKLRDEFKSLLFVLPIDDFDQNPSRCLEILRLVRMITVPRMFFIILGDIEIIQHIMKVSVFSEIVKIPGQSVPDSLFNKYSDDIYSIADNISVDSINKLIPYNQIIFIDQMTVKEALDKCYYSDFNVLPAKDYLTINKLLHRISITNGYKLSHILNPFSHVFGNYSEDGINFEDYTALSIFEAPIRRNLDIWLALYSIVEQNEHHYIKIMDLVIEFTRQAITRDTQLDYMCKHYLLKTIRKKQPAQWRTNTILSLESPSSPETILTFEKNLTNITAFNEKVFFPELIIRIPFSTDLTIMPPSDQKAISVKKEFEDISGAKIVSNETKGWLALLNDLNVINEDNSQKPIVEMDKANLSKWLSTQWRFGIKKIRVDWPTPEKNQFLTFRTLDFLKTLIRINIKISDNKNENSIKKLERIVFIWIAFINDSSLTFNIQQSIIEKGIDHFKDDISKDAIENLLILSSPEIGLPSELCAKIFDLIDKTLINDARVIKIKEKRISNLLKDDRINDKNFLFQLNVISRKLEEAEKGLEDLWVKIDEIDMDSLKTETKTALQKLKDDFYTMHEDDINSICKELDPIYNKISSYIGPDDTLRMIINTLKTIKENKIEMNARNHPLNRYENGRLRLRMSDFEDLFEDQSTDQSNIDFNLF